MENPGGWNEKSTEKEKGELERRRSPPGLRPSRHGTWPLTPPGCLASTALRPVGLSLALEKVQGVLWVRECDMLEDLEFTGEAPREDDQTMVVLTLWLH